VLRLRDKLANHSLDNSDVAIQQTANSSSEECNPNVGCEAKYDHAEGSANAAHEKHRLSSDAIRQAAPEHAHGGFAQCEGGDEKTRVERGVIFVAEVELLDEGPSVRVDRSQSYGLGETHNGYGQFVSILDGRKAVRTKDVPRRKS
jgi:hypothetical protein